MTDYTAKHDPQNAKYTVDLEGGYQAFATYSDREGVRYILHTEVPNALRGGGYGKILMEAVLAKMEADGVEVVPLCSYARIYMKRHPEWNHLLPASQ